MRALGIRWSLVIGLVGALALVSARASRAAPPRQEAPACRWERLASGERRAWHTLIDVPTRGVLSFGGVDGRSGETEIKDDVHLLDLSAPGPGTWRELPTTGNGPGDRAYHAAVLHTRPGGGFEMVTFGGVDSLSGASGALQGRAYRLDLQPAGGAWSAINAAGGQPRTEHSAIYWPAKDAMLVFGGRQSVPVNNLLTLTLGVNPAWSALAAEGIAPTARVLHSAVYDSDGDRMIVFGGTRNYSAGNAETWALNLAGDQPTWEELRTVGEAPSARYGHAAAYVPANRWMVVFAGTRTGSDNLDDLYALDLSSAPPRWMRLEPGGSTRPAGGENVAAVYSSTREAVVFTGGHEVGTNATSDRTWALVCDAPAQTTATPTPTATPGETNIDLAGRVYDADTGAGIVGALVVVPPCQTPHQSFSATSGVDGQYRLTLPWPYFVPGCTVEITVSAAGYVPLVRLHPWEELLAQPRRDFALQPSPASVTPTVPPDTATPTVTLEPTATATPTGGHPTIELSGVVYDVDVGPGAGLSGARVVAPPCQSPHQSFEATSGADGQYRLALPYPYFLPGCQIEITVTRTGYQKLVVRATWDELAAQPQRDFGMQQGLVDWAPLYVPFASRAVP